MSDERTIESCRLCPRTCGAPRDSEHGFGYCKMPALPVVARAGLHFFEEPCISGSRGSGAVFFSGCTLRCVYCQNEKISAGGFGKPVSVRRLADIFRELEAAGAHNINLVSADPFLIPVIRALELYHPKIPVVFNCGGYETVESLRMLEGYADIYLPDFKYVHDDRAVRYSAAPGYFETAQAALLEMQRQIGTEVMEGTVMRRGMIVRHLILPQGTAEAIAAAAFVCDRLPLARFSLMSQYLPCGQAAQYPELNRKITRREYEKVCAAVADMPFQNEVYVQELSSSSKAFIPAFDLSGV